MRDETATSPTVFGRTNRNFPKVWLRLETTPQSYSTDLQAFAESASSFGAPIDISASPALWGGLLFGRQEPVLMQVSSADIENAFDARNAADLVQAHLLQTLSSVGRSYIDFYMLRVRHTLEESHLLGIMEALESAREEESILFLGLHIESFAAGIGNWQFHDAFEVVSVADSMEAEDRDTLKRMAHQRRAGFLLRSSRAAACRGVEDTLLLSVNPDTNLSSLGEAS